MSITIIFVSIIVALLLIAVATMIISKNEKHTTDYNLLFIMGIIWIPMGIVLDYSLFLIIGIVFMTIGMVNKDKWKKHHSSKISDIKQRLIYGVLIALGLITLAAGASLMVIDK